MGCTNDDLAFFYGCSVRTVERRIRAPEDGEEPSELWTAWCLGKAGLRSALRKRQLEVAMGSSKAAVHMLIHMSKHQLGESDKALLGIGKGQDGGLRFIIEG